MIPYYTGVQGLSKTLEVVLWGSMSFNKCRLTIDHNCILSLNDDFQKWGTVVIFASNYYL